MADLHIDDGHSTAGWDLTDLRTHGRSDPDRASAWGRHGNALPVSAVLDTDRPWVTVTSSDHGYTASIPASQILTAGWLLVGSTDRPLSEEEGGPIRLLVDDGDTLCWNVKHVGSLRATSVREPDSVPERPTH